MSAASYGEAELRMAPWLRGRRAEFFVASKTGGRQAGRGGLAFLYRKIGLYVWWWRRWRGTDNTVQYPGTTQ